jgi:hypothetical protein
VECRIGAIHTVNSVAICVVIAFLLAAAFAYIALRRSTQSVGIERALSLMASLDIDAFCNLVDPEEDAFLQSCLPDAQLQKIRRERAWAALAYARALSHIAFEFSRFGHALRQSQNSDVAELGRDLATGALNLRVMALQAAAKLFIAAAFPRLPQRSPRLLLDQYFRSVDLVARYRTLEEGRKLRPTRVVA